MASIKNNPFIQMQKKKDEEDKKLRDWYSQKIRQRSMVPNMKIINPYSPPPPRANIARMNVSRKLSPLKSPESLMNDKENKSKDLGHDKAHSKSSLSTTQKKLDLIMKRERLKERTERLKELKRVRQSVQQRKSDNPFLQSDQQRIEDMRKRQQLYLERMNKQGNVSETTRTDVRLTKSTGSFFEAQEDREYTRNWNRSGVTGKLVIPVAFHGAESPKKETSNLKRIEEELAKIKTEEEAARQKHEQELIRKERLRKEKAELKKQNERLKREAEQRAVQERAQRKEQEEREKQQRKKELLAQEERERKDKELREKQELEVQEKRQKALLQLEEEKKRHEIERQAEKKAKAENKQISEASEALSKKEKESSTASPTKSGHLPAHSKAEKSSNSFSNITSLEQIERRRAERRKRRQLQLEQLAREEEEWNKRKEERRKKRLNRHSPKDEKKKTTPKTNQIQRRNSEIVRPPPLSKSASEPSLCVEILSDCGGDESTDDGNMDNINVCLKQVVNSSDETTDETSSVGEQNANDSDESIRGRESLSPGKIRADAFPSTDRLKEDIKKGNRIARAERRKKRREKRGKKFERHKTPEEIKWEKRMALKVKLEAIARKWQEEKKTALGGKYPYEVYPLVVDTVRKAQANIAFFTHTNISESLVAKEKEIWDKMARKREREMAAVKEAVNALPAKKLKQLGLGQFSSEDGDSSDDSDDSSDEGIQCEIGSSDDSDDEDFGWDNEDLDSTVADEEEELRKLEDEIRALEEEIEEDELSD